MPEKDVKLTALFEDIIYDITVTNGMSSVPTAKYQEEVTVKANAPATGKEFDKWVVAGITLSDEDLAKSTLTFKMPASNVQRRCLQNYRHKRKHCSTKNNKSN